jgi:general secretion pathway protein E
MRLEKLIVEQGLLGPDSLARAQHVCSENGDRLDAVITRLGLVSERALASMLSTHLGMPIATERDFPREAIATELLANRFLRDSRALPLRMNDSHIEVAFADPTDSFAAEAIAFAVQREVVPLVGKGSDIEAALDRIYGLASASGEEAAAAPDEADLERLKDLASDAPVVRAVNMLIARAVDMRASDIHIEPTEEGLKVRMRVDGALQDGETLPAQQKAAVVSRIKVMAALDIAERRLPQDGRARVAVRGHEVDLRVATSPTIHGEGVVLRILDRSNLALNFDLLGFDRATERAFIELLEKPHGIVLVTGPTGSGKTTTLYAALTALNTTERKILTIEDPIEYRLAGINQMQVKPQIGLTFAAALRSFLRQDPDVMMVGEVRDLETAQVAVQAALTGHTILSTLHTNSAASTVTRLLDMGVEPFLVTSTLNGILAQRLVRRLCQQCREPLTTSDPLIEGLGLSASDGAPFYHARGCIACNNTGYHGRLAIVELLPMDEEISRLILARAEAREIQRAASSMRTMYEDGIIKARAGLTTVEEVVRVTREG